MEVFVADSYLVSKSRGRSRIPSQGGRSVGLDSVRGAGGRGNCVVDPGSSMVVGVASREL